VDRAFASPGTPLKPALRQEMEQCFGYDFSSVRVHSDAAAAQSTRDIDAYAYVVGHRIVFGAGRFAPETHEGRRLIAHELTHVVQQSRANGHAWTRVQRSPDKLAARAKRKGEPNKGAQQVPFRISFDRPLTREQFIDLAESTIYGHRTPGDWVGVPTHFKAEDSPVTVLVSMASVKSEARKGIEALRPDIKEFLMKRRPARSYADLDSLRRAGQILELNGVTNDELLLLDYRRGAESLKPGQKVDPVEWAEQFVLERQSATVKALTNRATLVESIGRLEYLSQHEKGNLKAVREGLFGFDTIDNILIHHDNLRTAPLIEAFEFELKSITKAFLAQSQVALLRIEQTYLANKDVASEKEALGQAIAIIRPEVEQRDKAEHEVESQAFWSGVSGSAVRKEIFGTPDTELDQARENLEKANERLKQQSKAAGLEVAGWQKFDLDAIRGTDIEVSRNHLRYFVDDARLMLAKAEVKTQDINTLYKADRMLALTKAAIGIKAGSPMDDIIAARAKQATSDSSFWNTVWDVVTFALMFVPGNIGIALQVAAGLVNAAEAMDELSEGTQLHEAGLASQAPSSLGVVLAVGGTLIDASQMAKGVFKISEEAGIVTKFGTETSATKSAVILEGEETVRRVGQDVAEQPARELKSESAAKVGKAPPHTYFPTRPNIIKPNTVLASEPVSGNHVVKATGKGIELCSPDPCPLLRDVYKKQLTPQQEERLLHAENNRFSDPGGATAEAAEIREEVELALQYSRGGLDPDRRKVSQYQRDLERSGLWGQNRVGAIAKRDLERKIEAVLPPTTRVEFVATESTEAGIAQGRAAAREGTIVNPEVEPQIDLPNAIRKRAGLHVPGPGESRIPGSFKPDDIEFFGGKSYRFKDHKEVTTIWEESFYSTETARSKIRELLYRDLDIARALQPNCKGFAFTTNSKELKLLLAEEIGKLPKDARNLLHTP
jgi:hypothetical protein